MNIYSSEKNLKKITFALILVILILCSGVFIFAGQASISLDAPEFVNLGKKLVVDIRIDGNPEWDDLWMRLYYDRSILEYESFEKGAVARNADIDIEGEYSERNNEPLEIDIYSHGFYDLYDVSDEDFEDEMLNNGNGKIIRLTFKAISSGKCNLSLDTDGCSFWNANITDEFVNKEIQVKSYGISEYKNACIKVNENWISSPGIIKEGRTLVPLRGVFEELGYEADYNADTKSVTLKGEKYRISMQNENGPIYCWNLEDGHKDEIVPDVPQQIINGHFYIPLRAVSEAVGSDVSWDSDRDVAEVNVGYPCNWPPDDSEYWENLTYNNAIKLLKQIKDKTCEKNVVFVYYNYGCLYSCKYVPQFKEFAEKNKLHVYAYNWSESPSNWVEYSEAFSALVPYREGSKWPDVVTYNSLSKEYNGADAVHSLDDFKVLLQKSDLY